jgi:DNA-binding MarR family transcriptional regulator/GNAT superfamily N-acetyltransferase
MQQIDTVRRFSRTVTQRVGALDEGFLGRGRPLGAARILWEIGPAGAGVGELRECLGLDSGYLSRMLRALEGEGLVTVAPDPADRRRRRAALTPAGLTEHAELDARSDARARELLSGLSPTQQERLVGAMEQVDRLLTAALVELRPADPEHPDAVRCVTAYFDELHRRDGFDPSASLTVEPDEARPPRGLFLLAVLRGEAIGCGAVKHLPDGVSEIKRVWVADAARGMGVGRRLLEALEDEARRAGAHTARLDTNRTLTEAIAMYRSAGYDEVPPFNDEPFAYHWFAKRL